MLKPEDQFSYEYAQQHPKTFPEQQIGDEIYYLRCVNGFVKLHTLKGLTYLCAQNTHNHRTPDWKLHFSIHPEDLAKAWNILAHLFIEKQCRFAMKVTMGDEWPSEMVGREITVYLFQYDQSYVSAFATDESADEKLLPDDFEGEAFWQNFIEEAEERLLSFNIRSAGLAKGDQKLGKYVSLRNEAFVTEKEKRISFFGAKPCMQYIYPPNSVGYNGMCHQLPFDIKPFLEPRSCCSFRMR